MWATDDGKELGPNEEERMNVTRIKWWAFGSTGVFGLLTYHIDGDGLPLLVSIMLTVGSAAIYGMAAEAEKPTAALRKEN
jgi:hypothetical protein